MTNILRFQSFLINEERLGIVEELDDIANIIIKELSDKNYFELKSTLNSVSFTLECYKNTSKVHNFDAVFTTIDLKSNLFKIIITELNKDILIHELKHLHRALFLNKKIGKPTRHQLVNHVSDIVSSNYKHLFNSKDSKYIFQKIIYYSNPNEFEAYFNQIYSYLEPLIKNDNSSKEEKIDKVKEFLNNQEIFIIYRYFNEKDFSISDFVNDNDSANFIANEINRLISARSTGSQGISFYKKISSYLKMFSFLKKSDVLLNKEVKEINYMVNKSIKNNYRKFFRIFSLLFDES
jgi:hypothetical protein